MRNVDQPLRPDLRTQTAALISARGERGAAAELHLSRNTLVRAAGGFALKRTTARLIELSLGALPAGGAPTATKGTDQ